MYFLQDPVSKADDAHHSDNPPEWVPTSEFRGAENGDGPPLGAECIILERLEDTTSHFAPSLLLWSLDFFESMETGDATTLGPCQMKAGLSGAQLIVA